MVSTHLRKMSQIRNHSQGSFRKLENIWSHQGQDMPDMQPRCHAWIWEGNSISSSVSSHGGINPDGVAEEAPEGSMGNDSMMVNHVAISWILPYSMLFDKNALNFCLHFYFWTRITKYRCLKTMNRRRVCFPTLNSHGWFHARLPPGQAGAEVSAVRWT